MINPLAAELSCPSVKWLALPNLSTIDSVKLEFKAADSLRLAP